MDIDRAVTDALEKTLSEATGQSEEFRKRFRTLVGLVLSSNYKDSDVRRVMELLAVELDGED